MARRRRTVSRKKLIPLIFKRNGETIRHIDLQEEAVTTEVTRLQAVIHDVLRLLARAPRCRHFIFQNARFKLKRAIESFVQPASTEQAVAEVGRLNFILADAGVILSRMRSTFAALDEARFAIRYGQTARKREAGWNSFKKDRDHESIPDPEEAVYAEDSED